jgi:hypothetical protein
MADQQACRCGGEWIEIASFYSEVPESLVCEACGATAPPELRVVLAAERVLETASRTAHREQAAELAPPDWVESTEARRAWDAYQRNAALASNHLVDLPQRPEARDRRRVWTWGQVVVDGVIALACVLWIILAVKLILGF